jgi:hypothetical protein
MTDQGGSILHVACRAAADAHPTCWSVDAEHLGAAALEVVCLLLNYGADLEAKDGDRTTPLFYTLDGYVTKNVIKDVEEWAIDGPASVPAKNSLDEKCMMSLLGVIT